MSKTPPSVSLCSPVFPSTAPPDDDGGMAPPLLLDVFGAILLLILSNGAAEKFWLNKRTKNDIKACCGSKLEISDTNRPHDTGLFCGSIVIFFDDFTHKLLTDHVTDNPVNDVEKKENDRKNETTGTGRTREGPPTRSQSHSKW
uniref:Uncharacterized protein n=1 Tax=Romanomermis culicivorax TaxID=13658 RepID=A0A915IDN4_ROMCU